MARDTSVRHGTESTDDGRLPNLVTIVGRGVPSNFEISVGEDLEMVGDEPAATGTIVSGGVAEGSIEVGIQRFRFSGELANVRVVDWNGDPAPESPSTPKVHVDYGISGR